MNHPIHGANAGEVAKLPLKLNLQLFADDGETEPEEPADVEWESFDSDKSQEEAEESEEAPEVADPEQEEEPPQRDFEKDKAFAEMRRKAEEAERKIKRQDEWAKANYGHLGINTMEDYRISLEEQRKRETYADKGLDYDEMKKAIRDELEGHPDVVKARQTQEEAEIQREINALNTAYPDVKLASIDDILKLPNSEEIVKRVQRGYSLKDAYELANQNDIIAKRVAAAEQAARNKIKSKDHLKPGSNGDAGEVFVVPDDVMRQYREVNRRLPKGKQLTEDQMRDHYKKSVKG